MKVCQRVLYSGRVQGVGFRYATSRLAEAFPVVGYVRNLPTGDVEVVAEGATEAVSSFLEKIACAMAENIEQVRKEECPSGGWNTFSIRH